MNYLVIKTKKLLKNLIETPKINWIDKFVCLGSKMYAFLCGNDSKNKLKGVSKSSSKNISFEEFYNGLFGEEYQQECDKVSFRSLNQKSIFNK